MSDTNPGRAQLHASLKQVLPLVAIASGLVAAWLAWSGWQQHRDETRRSEVQQVRDEAVQAATFALRTEYKRIQDRLGTAPMQESLVAGDLVSAGRRLADGWPLAKQAQVLAPDLASEYGQLPQGGFGRLAAAEAAIAAGQPIAWVVKEKGGSQLAIAAPAKVGNDLAGVAYVLLPLQRITSTLEQGKIAEDSYIALRQGGSTLLERGDAALAGGAEALAAKIPGSELRVAAAVPDVAGGPFGLGALPCFLAAILFGLIALVASRLPKVLARKGEPEDDAAAPTLAEAVTVADIAPLPKLEAASPPKQEGAGGEVVIDRGIFRAYDIRGVVGQSLDVGVAVQIGQAIGSLMHEQGLTEIVIGRDGRLSGPSLTEGLIAGLRKAGRNVIDIGMAPTPVTYFGAYLLRAGSCVSVTGSHNPPDYNGFKVVVGGETLSGTAITDLYDRIAGGRLHAADTLGGMQVRDISEDYVQRIASDVQIDRPLRVVVDAGNGVAGDIGPRVLTAVGAEVTPLYCEIDGTFPNHHPDPSEPHNLNDLIKMVQRLDADLGIAFDGDGDRLGVVTRDGQNIFPDRLLMLFAADVLDRNPGAQIIFDVKCTGRLPGHILRHGGSPLMWKTGHSLIKAKMRETDAELAGEMSGHFFFKERWYGFDDGIYAAARLLEILASRPQPAGETLASLPDGISTPEIKVDAPDGDPHTFVERFRNAARFEGARLSTIDGLRVDWADGWGLVRASNTTPVLVLRFDADSQQALDRIKSDFRTQLLALKSDLVLPF
ncbi:phosphomannomutase/phosphoglucomutase [Lysobacter niastensis]|uniref:phosphomannomutase n=1 Tax=Lysobacter niastensis TaxID=380629 RepID=A0ABS0BAR2_9GAMM|nr:phosphomannomutase/phosphoglucomutase [Lysobacter niastensis]MBF6026080.1 phosphomannomutase/phosphoglucomutase [Lysobacter niastensis]